MLRGRRLRGRGKDRVVKNARKKRNKQHPISIKKSVLNKQPVNFKKANRTLRSHKYAVRTYFLEHSEAEDMGVHM